MALMNNLLGWTDTNRRPMVSTPVKSIASIAAILFAVGSFIVQNAGGKMVMAVVAVVFGLVGLMRAASPRVSGGVLSLAAIAIAVLGFVVAIFDAIF